VGPLANAGGPLANKKKKSLEMIVTPDGMCMSVEPSSYKTRKHTEKRKNNNLLKTKKHQLSKCKLKGPGFHI